MLDGISALAAVLAVLAGLLHVYIWVMESFLWVSPRTRATFGVGSEEEAATTRTLAYNQGWYNLFLAVGAIGGALISLLAEGDAAVAGTTMVLVATVSMVGAALVLVTRNVAMARAAAVQGTLPLLAVLAVLIG